MKPGRFTNEIANEEFAVKPGNPHKKRARQQDFFDPKEIEVDGFNRRRLRLVTKEAYVTSDAVIIEERFDLMQKKSWKSRWEI